MDNLNLALSLFHLFTAGGAGIGERPALGSRRESRQERGRQTTPAKPHIGCPLGENKSARTSCSPTGAGGGDDDGGRRQLVDTVLKIAAIIQAV